MPYVSLSLWNIKQVRNGIINSNLTLAFSEICKLQQYLAILCKCSRSSCCLQVSGYTALLFGVFEKAFSLMICFAAIFEFSFLVSYCVCLETKIWFCSLGVWIYQLNVHIFTMINWFQGAHEAHQWWIPWHSYFSNFNLSLLFCMNNLAFRSYTSSQMAGHCNIIGVSWSWKWAEAKLDNYTSFQYVNQCKNVCAQQGNLDLPLSLISGTIFILFNWLIQSFFSSYLWWNVLSHAYCACTCFYHTADASFCKLVKSTGSS